MQYAGNRPVGNDLENQGEEIYLHNGAANGLIICQIPNSKFQKAKTNHQKPSSKTKNQSSTS